MAFVERVTTKAPAGNTLVKRPSWVGSLHAWRQVRVETIRSGQPRPYADAVYEYLVTFEGGTPSTREHFDLPYGIWRGEHLQDKVKEVCRLITRPWRAEKGDRKMGDSWLDVFECVESEDTHTTYRLVVIEPFMD